MKAFKTVILANGNFPKKGTPASRLLEGARRVIACDGAAMSYRRHFKKWPDVIIGDCDSIPLRRVPKIVRERIRCVPDQNTNDLTKAIGYAHSQKWSDAVIVGATGRRDDHSLGNIFRALESQLPVVTDRGVFNPVNGSASFVAKKGTAVSVFAPDRETRMTSVGLQWPLDDVVFKNLYVATLNRTTQARFCVTSNRPVFVYIAFASSEPDRKAR